MTLKTFLVSSFVSIGVLVMSFSFDPVAQAQVNVPAESAELESVSNEEVIKPEKEYWYRVELLTFAYVKTGEENSELWPRLSSPDFSNNEIHHFKYNEQLNALAESQISQDIANKENVTANDEAQLRLSPKLLDLVNNRARSEINIQESELSDFKNIIMKMKINGHYKILDHRIWKQKLLDKEEQDLIFIRGGKNYPLSPSLSDQKQDKGTRPLITQLDLSVANKELDANGSQDQAKEELEVLMSPQFEGTISLYLSRFLHVKTDLWLHQFLQHDALECTNLDYQALEGEEALLFAQAEVQETDQVYYFPHRSHQLKQHRKLKNNELHYIDHPLFGLLVKFTPLKMENTEDALNEIVEEEEEIID